MQIPKFVIRRFKTSHARGSGISPIDLLQLGADSHVANAFHAVDEAEAMADKKGDAAHF